MLGRCPEVLEPEEDVARDGDVVDVEETEDDKDAVGGDAGQGDCQRAVHHTVLLALPPHNNPPISVTMTHCSNIA